MFRFSIFCLSLSLAACGGDSLPDSTKSSVNIDTNNLRMDVHVQAQDAETDPADNGVFVHVDLYRITNSGYIQTVDLEDGDSFSLTGSNSTSTLTKNYYPNVEDALGIDYSTQLATIVDGEELTLALNRQTEIDAPNSILTVLPPTPFSVTPSATPLTQAGTLTLNWTPVTGYEYAVSFRFSCGENDDQVVQGIRFPNRYFPSSVSSPFVFTFADYFVYPSDADVNSTLTNCTLRATLWSYQDQSVLGDPAFANVFISSGRVQRISTPIQRN